MDIRNCKTCGKLFDYIGGQQLCNNCRKKLDEKFEEVKNYLRQNPICGVNEVAEETGVSVKQIKQWIREERLTLTSAGSDGITCEQCGAPIMTGRFCLRCKSSMANKFSGVLVQPQEPEDRKDTKNRMRFLQ